MEIKEIECQLKTAERMLVTILFIALLSGGLCLIPSIWGVTIVVGLAVSTTILTIVMLWM